MSEIVVAYYSRTGQTRKVCEKLAGLLGADLEEIGDAKSRRGLLGCLVAGKDAAFGKSTTLTTSHSLEGRKVVVLGTPVWAGGPAPAVQAYLNEVDLSGVTVFALCTFNGGEGKTFHRIEQFADGRLAGTLALRKPAKDPKLDAKLEPFAERIRKAAGS